MVLSDKLPTETLSICVFFLNYLVYISMYIQYTTSTGKTGCAKCQESLFVFAENEYANQHVSCVDKLIK